MEYRVKNHHHHHHHQQQQQQLLLLLLLLQLFSGQHSRTSRLQNVKPIWILLEQETVEMGGGDDSWNSKMCKAPVKSPTAMFSFNTPQLNHQCQSTQRILKNTNKKNNENNYSIFTVAQLQMSLLMSHVVKCCQMTNITS